MKIGVTALYQRLSSFLRRLGQRADGRERERLIAEGRVQRSTRPLPEPLQLDGDPYGLSRALAEIRAGR
jgi:hypothetical protein